MAKIVKMAINDWEKSLGNLIQFKYTKDEDSKPDIKIDFKKEKGQKVGEICDCISILLGLSIMWKSRFLKKQTVSR